MRRVKDSLAECNGFLSSLEILIYLFLVLTMMASTISGLKHKTFKKAAFANGTSVCAIDSPSEVVYTENIICYIASLCSSHRMHSTVSLVFLLMPKTPELY